MIDLLLLLVQIAAGTFLFAILNFLLMLGIMVPFSEEYCEENQVGFAVISGALLTTLVALSMSTGAY